MGGPGSGGWNKGRQSDRTKMIIDLRRSGKSFKEIASIVGCSFGHCGKICRDAGMGGPIIEQRLTESQVADIVSRSGFDYVGGYTMAKAPITVRCRECGRTFERQFHIFRDVVNGTWQAGNECPLCRQDQTRKRQEQREADRQADREREAHERAQHKAEQLSRKVSDELMKRLAIHVCKNCGTEFCTMSSGYNSKTYCSEACQKRYHDRIKRDKRVKRIKSSEMDNDITLEKLFKRDGGMCYLCGRECDWSDGEYIDGIFVAGDCYPSIDHVVPVSKGGTHTWKNIKLACRECNTLKGWR